MPEKQNPEKQNQDKAKQEQAQQEKTQQKLMQFQFLQSQLEAVRAQLQQIVQHAEEIANAKLTIENLTITKPSEAFVPLGAGNFVKGRIEDSSTVLVSIGGGAAVKKSKEDAIKIIEGKISKLQDEADELVGVERKIASELARLQPEIQTILGGR